MAFRRKRSGFKRRRGRRAFSRRRGSAGRRKGLRQRIGYRM